MFDAYLVTCRLVNAPIFVDDTIIQLNFGEVCSSPILFPAQISHVLINPCTQVTSEPP